MQALATPSATLDVGQVSRQLVHAGDTAWDWKILIGGRPVSEARAASVSYDDQGVGTADLIVSGDLTRPNQVGADVRVFCGYGNSLIEWFTGKLGKPVYDSATQTTSAGAYAISGMLARRYFDQPARYQGATFQSFFADLNARLMDPRTRIEVKNGARIAMEDSVFSGENALLEAATSVVEPAEYKISDMPQWTMLVIPRPRPGAGVRAKATFGADQFAPGDPKIVPSDGGPYYKVVAFRRDDQGQEIVRAEQKITNRSPHRPSPNEIYWLPDYQGTQLEAQQTALDTARALEIDSFKGTVTDVAPNPELHLHDPVHLLVEEDRPGNLPDVLCTYAAIITEIEIDLLASMMSFSFEALRTGERERQAPIWVPPRSPYVMPTPGPDTAFGLSADGLYARLDHEEPYFGVDAGGMWIDPAASPGTTEAGEDPLEGLWVETS